MLVYVNDSATVATEEVGLVSTAHSSYTMEHTRPMNSSSQRLATCRPKVDGSVSFVVSATLVADASEGGCVAIVTGCVAIIADLVLRRVEYGPVHLGAA